MLAPPLVLHCAGRRRARQARESPRPTDASGEPPQHRAVAERGEMASDGSLPQEEGQDMALKHLLAGVAVIGLMAQTALGQNQDTTQQQLAQAQQLAQEDMEFANKAAGDGMAEVKLGELAQQNAEDDQVKQFGQRMVDDHSKANDELKSIAQQKGIDLPKDLPAEAQQAYDELQQKSGDEFDQAYMDLMVEDHQKAIDLFQQEAKSGKDADLQTFAEETLPTLEEHLDLAQQTQKQISASAGQSEQPATATGQAEQPAAAARSEQQQPAHGQQQAGTQAQQQQAGTEAEPSISIKEVLGSKVVNAKGDQVGEIEDLVVDQNQIRYAVLSVGGFLGIGEKKVAVPFDELQLGDNEAYLMSATTEQQLEQMPEYDEGQYQPFQQHG
jgi:putative membrane protein